MKVTKANFEAVAQAAWAKAIKMPQFGYADIASVMSISVEQATRIVRAWVREGSVEQVQAATGKGRSLWRAYPDFVRVDATRPRSPEENMWTALRRLRSATPTDLAAHATTETVTVSREDASEYCRALLDAGFLTVARKADTASGREAIYRLTEVTGVQAPILRRVRAVYDPNTGVAHVISQIGGGVQ